LSFRGQSERGSFQNAHAHHRLACPHRGLAQLSSAGTSRARGALILPWAESLSRQVPNQTGQWGAAGGVCLKMCASKIFDQSGFNPWRTPLLQSMEFPPLKAVLLQVICADSANDVY
jgi:hypothetical protein